MFINIYFFSNRFGVVKVRALYMLGKYSTIRLYNIPFINFLLLRQGFAKLPQLALNMRPSCLGVMGNWYYRPALPGPTPSLLSDI